MENTIKDLPLTLNWSKGVASKAGKIYESKSTLLVPSDYNAPAGSTISLSLTRWTQKNEIDNSGSTRINIILLAGGPGGSIGGYTRLICDLIEHFADQISVYEVDHRGLGQSTPFPRNIFNFKKGTFELSTSFTNNFPFPIDNLTLDMAAYDVGAIAQAIKNTSASSMSSSLRIGIYGFSYGATLGWHSVSLLPKTFDFAHLGGLSREYGGGKEKGIPGNQVNHQGLVEHCHLDPFCKGHFFGKFDTALQVDIERIIESNTNPCTKHLHNILQTTDSSSKDHKWTQISLLLSTLLKGRSSSRQMLNLDQAKMHPSQLLLSFVKATSECANPGDYYENVLLPIKPYLTPLMHNDTKNFEGSKKKSSSSTVNTIIMTDAFYSFDCNDKNSPKINHKSYDLTDTHQANLNYYNKNKLLCSLRTPAYKKSKIGQIHTDRTEIYIYASRLDMITPYPTAWKMYSKDIKRSKAKQWILFDGRGHDGHYGQTLLLSIAKSVDHASVGERTILNSLKSTILSRAKDWRYPHPWSAHWHQIQKKTATNTPMRSLSPNFISSHGSIEYSSFTGETSRKQCVFEAIVAFGLVLGVAVLIGLLHFVYTRIKCKRNNNQSIQQNRSVKVDE